MLIYRYLLIFVGHNWLGRQWPWSFLDIWWWCSAIIFKETWPESYCTCTSGDIFMYFYSHIPRTWSSFAFVFFLFVAFHILGFFSQGGNSWFWHEIYPLKNRPGSQRKIADIEFVYFIPFWFFSQVVEDGYRFFEKRKVCQAFGLWRHCELNSLITSVLNKNIYRPVTHVISTSHKSRRHVHAQSPNQPNVSTVKAYDRKPMDEVITLSVLLIIIEFIEIQYFSLVCTFIDCFEQFNTHWHRGRRQKWHLLSVTGVTFF